MTTAEVIRDNYLKTSRPRSEAFQTGLFYVLQRRLGRTPQLIECPFRLGTADADAWFAGCAEGVEAWSRREEFMQ